MIQAYRKFNRLAKQNKKQTKQKTNKTHTQKKKREREREEEEEEKDICVFILHRKSVIFLCRILR